MEDDCPSGHSSISFGFVAKTMNMVVLYFSEDWFSHDVSNNYHVCQIRDCALYRGSYMSAHVLLNSLNELGKRDQMRGLPSILSLFRNEFNVFNNTRA